MYRSKGSLLACWQGTNITEHLHPYSLWISSKRDKVPHTNVLITKHTNGTKRYKCKEMPQLIKIIKYVPQIVDIKLYLF